MHGNPVKDFIINIHSNGEREREKERVENTEAVAYQHTLKK